MPHTVALANRADHPDALSRHIVNGYRTLLQAAARALAGIGSPRRELPSLAPMSDHVMKDIGVEGDLVRRACTTRHDQWPWWSSVI